MVSLAIIEANGMRAGVQFAHPGLKLVSAGNFRHVEVLGSFLQHDCRRHGVVRMDQSMGRQDDQARIAHADHGGHNVIERLSLRPVSVLRAHLVAIVERRLIAMMSIRNDQIALRFHLLLDGPDSDWILDHPDHMAHVLLTHRSHIDVRLTRHERIQYRVDLFLRVGIEHEYLPHVDFHSL